ncbi:unnamed protein product [Periconia digitata]|uniref:ubiquitinyl hydrolase 1 n=1 Tax=Periconia digitata TaxID=1303443 RepID=A0A9W4UCV7_9PLEO|nr:unnamed protein product [Periconia digitata]
MNGVSRFLSRRDKHNEKRTSRHWRNKSRSTPSTVSSELYKVFTNEGNDATSKDKDLDKKVKMLLHRLQSNGIADLGEEQAEHALRWCPDDLDKAYDLLVLVNESFEGELKDYNPDLTMLGAVNRNMVTCYLDALLFAMFACLDSFEAMLYNDFNDEPRKKLAGVLRLWVNLLRSGWLIKTDLTKHLQDSLAKCGWEEAAHLHQQDASEAFTFITGALELPLLTLKMDIFHTGREDKEDDHKFVNERLLEVAIPELEDGKIVTLEQCLEEYFNNRIEVKRHLQRQNTFSSTHTTKDPEKSQAIHIEALEVSGSESPAAATPTTLEFPTVTAASRPPMSGRRRGDSIFTERYTVSSKPGFDEKQHLDEMLEKSSEGRPRSASLRKEVMMPAWQFFNLIPWYTDNAPQTDAQVAAHFSSKRPVLGICLKRYMMTLNGAPKRLDTYIDIPLEIGLPHFISDERMSEDGPLFGNFKLVLQSVVCHRGVTVDSGHYVALVRANSPRKTNRPSSAHSEEEEVSDTWLRFDDLANPRTSTIDITKALKEESPYLLFFQVQPIDEELALRGDPPPYAEAQSDILQATPSKETITSETEVASTTTDPAVEWESVTAADTMTPITDINISETPGRSSISSMPDGSTVLEELDSRGRSGPSTPGDEKGGFLTSSRRNSRAWLAGGKNSRPGSQNGENRLSVTISRLAGRASKDKLQVTDTRDPAPQDPVIVVQDVPTLESTEIVQPSSPGKKKKDGGSLGRSKSKNKKPSKEDKKIRKSKSLEPINGVAVKGKSKARERPDRECLVM